MNAKRQALLHLAFLAAVVAWTVSSHAQTYTPPGEPIVANSTGGLVTTPIFVDATQFTSGGTKDMCQAIVAARQSSGCDIAAYGCYIAAPFTGVRQCSVDPFGNNGLGNSWTSGGTLDLRSDKLLDIRTSVTWHIPQGVHVIGSGVSSPGSGNFTWSTGYQNTILRANNTAIFSSGTNPEFSTTAAASHAITSITSAGNVATVFATHTLCSSGSPNQGQDVMIYPAPVHGTAHFLAMNIDCTSTGSGPSFQISVPSLSGPACTSACGTEYEVAPVVHIGSAGSGAQYNVQLEGFSIDCAFEVPCVPYLNDNGEEGTWFHNMHFLNSGTEYVRLSEVPTVSFGDGQPATGGGASQSGPYYDFVAQLLPETCEVSGCGGSGTRVDETNANLNPQGLNPLNCGTLGILIDGPNSGTTSRNHIGQIHDFTISQHSAVMGSTGGPASMSSSLTACGVPNSGGSAVTPIAVLAYGTMLDISDFHQEYFNGDVQIGGSTSLNAAFPGINYGGTPTLVTTSAVTVHNFDLCCGDTNGDGASYAVDLGPRASNTLISAWHRLGPGGANLLLDEVTGNVCNQDANNEGWYFLGQGASPRVSTSCTGISEALSAGLKVSNLLVSGTAPTISSGFGTGPSITTNGTGAMTITIGTTPGSAGTLNMPTAAHGWACSATDQTTPADFTRQSAQSTTSVTLTNYNSAGTATNWAASSVIVANCSAY